MCLSSMLVDVIAIETLSRVIVAWARFAPSLLGVSSPFDLRIDRELHRDDHFSGVTLGVHMGLQVDSSRSSSL